MKRKNTAQKLFLAIYRYVLFFLLAAFIITSCMLLFLNTMAREMDVSFTGEDIRHAALLTFANVFLLSFLFTVIDAVRRKLTVERPVKRIVHAAQKVMQGDFSVRISSHAIMDKTNGFDEIITYFNRMVEELSGTETLRTDFIANVSHELKTPLAVMRNYSVMLQDPALSEEKRIAYAGIMADSAQKLADLTDNILKLNKLENQQIHPMKETFDLGEQLRECMLGFEHTWEEKNIEIETDIADDILVKSDAELLRLVWNNLLSNAFKFTPEGGKVSLCLISEGDTAAVFVKDTGCGIRKEIGTHIFEKFYQGDPSHSAKGNGLGLALVKRVIDIIGADISVESEVGSGSTFVVKMKRVNDDEMEKKD